MQNTKESSTEMWFGYPILIRIEFQQLQIWYQSIWDAILWSSNTSKMVKKTWLSPHFSSWFSVFRYLMKHSSCMVYYISNYINSGCITCDDLFKHLYCTLCGLSPVCDNMCSFNFEEVGAIFVHPVCGQWYCFPVTFPSVTWKQSAMLSC